MRSSEYIGIVLPLGMFGIVASQAAMQLRADELRAHLGEIPKDERLSVGRYLRGGRIIFSIMEHSRDVVDDHFGTPGGSAILTDGTYYWRYDAADYVEEYGVGLPQDFLERAKSSDWQVPAVSDELASSIDRWLYANIRRA